MFCLSSECENRCAAKKAAIPGPGEPRIKREAESVRMDKVSAEGSD